MTRATGAALLLAAALAGCGEGGELAEDTARRRALEAGDTAGADSAALLAQADTGYRVPAFLDTPPAAPPATDTVATPPPAGPPAGWSTGTTDVRRAGDRVEVVSGVRSGPQQGFDRLVVEFAGGRIPGYRIEYVETVRECGSGEPVRLAGQGALVLRLNSSQAHDGLGEPTVRPRERRVNGPVLREWRMVCDFEGQVEIALGVAGTGGYRVGEVSGPARLFVDVMP